MNKNKPFLIVVVMLVVLLAAIFGLTHVGAPKPSVSPVSTPAATVEPLGAIGGQVFSNIDTFTNGVGLGNRVLIARGATIQAGMNQVYWRNVTGRTIFVEVANVGYTSGTASSSLLFYVGATTTANFSTDYGRPNGAAAKLMIDGATVATSTAAAVTTFFTSTSTAAGFGTLAVPDQSYIVWQVQSKDGCKVVGACETATSTNRGISTFNAYFRGWYNQ